MSQSLTFFLSRDFSIGQWEASIQWRWVTAAADAVAVVCEPTADAGADARRLHRLQLVPERQRRAADRRRWCVPLLAPVPAADGLPADRRQPATLQVDRLVGRIAGLLGSDVIGVTFHAALFVDFAATRAGHHSALWTFSSHRLAALLNLHLICIIFFWIKTHDSRPCTVFSIIFIDKCL